jgi:hypothetical protein
MKSQIRWLTGFLVISLLSISACQDLTSVTEEPGQDENVFAKHDRTQSVGNAMHPVLNFRANLKGENEVPAVETTAQGQAIFKVSKDGSSIEYKLIAANIENVRMAHIHLAPAGVNGPVVAWLYPEGPPPQLIEGRFQGVLAEGVITSEDLVGPLEGNGIDNLIEKIMDGNTYVNVHTEQHPGGEIRGQIE